MKARRVVLDTNVIVAALRSDQGASYHLLMLLGSSAFEICITVSLAMEYESATMTEDYLERRAKRGNRKKFERAMAKVPSVPPMPGDEF